MHASALLLISPLKFDALEQMGSFSTRDGYEHLTLCDPDACLVGNSKMPSRFNAVSWRQTVSVDSPSTSAITGRPKGNSNSGCVPSPTNPVLVPGRRRAMSSRKIATFSFALLHDSTAIHFRVRSSSSSVRSSSLCSSAGCSLAKSRNRSGRTHIRWRC